MPFSTPTKCNVFTKLISTFVKPEAPNTEITVSQRELTERSAQESIKVKIHPILKSKFFVSNLNQVIKDCPEILLFFNILPFFV